MACKMTNKYITSASFVDVVMVYPLLVQIIYIISVATNNETETVTCVSFSVFKLVPGTIRNSSYFTCFWWHAKWQIYHECQFCWCCYGLSFTIHLFKSLAVARFLATARWQSGPGNQRPIEFECLSAHFIRRYQYQSNLFSFSGSVQFLSSLSSNCGGGCHSAQRRRRRIWWRQVVWEHPPTPNMSKCSWKEQPFKQASFWSEWQCSPCGNRCHPWIKYEGSVAVRTTVTQPNGSPLTRYV